MQRRHRMRAALLLLGALVALAGCSHDTERVLLPPVAPMEGIFTIAVVGVSNATVDPGIGLLFEQIVAEQLAGSDRYTVIDTFTARAALAKLNMSLDQLADPEAARRLGRELGADALITGTATYYFEDVRMSVPQCSGCSTPNATPYWSATQTTQVLTSFQARVIRTDNGVIVWSEAVDGNGTMSRFNSISWNQPTVPPDAVVPRADRSQIPAAREASVRDAAGKFTEDLLPRWVWVRKEG